MFDHIFPPSDTAVYAPTVPARISADMAHRVITGAVRDLDLIDARITEVTTGRGSFTAHHFDDFDYIVTLAVTYADTPHREHEAIYGIVPGVRWPELWAN